MIWQEKRLGDLADIQLGKMLNQKKNRGEYRPYLGNDNVQWNELKLDEIKLMRIQDSERERFRLRPGDLLVCEGGDPGRCALWTTNEEIYYQKALHRVRVGSELDPEYLLYYMMHLGTTQAIRQYYTGSSTIKHLPNAAIKRVVIRYPSLSDQKMIASYLRSYDALIENNRKQIKLLEEAAQRLYKEWFIDLRFPGHESVEIDPDTGLPEGWKESAFLDEVSFVRGKSYNADNLVDASEQQLINLSNIAPFGGWLPGGEKPYSGNCRADQIVSSGDILLAVTDMTKERRLVGHAAMVPRSLSGSVISMDLIKLNPNNIAPMYLYCLLRFSGVASMISMLANGTNVLHLKPESMNRVRILVPNLDVQGKFSQLVKPLFASIDCLSEQITIASEARNRLLPELLGGTDD